MKDWFMSLLGWLAIVSSGMIKVGDRIRVNSSDSGDVLGDILDISPLKITIYEDVTMLSYDKHKRAGRVVFIPNNLIFSKLIFNYSHNGLKTVWDSITFALTYDSDLDKAMGIIREVVHKHTKGFTKHKEKQTQKLRADYNIRGYSFEPRILTFIESYGISVSTWYQTDSYRALSMKSVISKDIFDNLKNEPDIKFAYPTSSIMLSDSERRIESERVIGE
jgi:small-conductance mechanosensitive channel